MRWIEWSAQFVGYQSGAFGVNLYPRVVPPIPATLARRRAATGAAATPFGGGDV